MRVLRILVGLVCLLPAAFHSWPIVQGADAISPWQVGVPAEFFTVLRLEIKRRSPYRYTFVCGLSNDYIGYTPSLQGFENGGYQAWMG